MKTELISPVKNGKLQLSTTRSILKVLSGLEGKKVRITLEKVSAKRSLSQNAYLHLLFTIFTDALNYLGNEFKMEEVKAICKTKFCTIDVINNNSGEVIGQRIKGTSEMNKMEMVEFIDSVIRWAADYFHITLPYPNEQLEIE
jgi:hypothetical protein